MPNDELKEKQLFFSYGHDDNIDLVKIIKEKLENEHYKVWIDFEGIKTWDDWRQKIIKGIQESDFAIAYLSKHSVREPGVCLSEIAILLDSGKKVYPILLEPERNCTPPTSLSYIQYLDLSNWKEKKENSEEEFNKWCEEKIKIILDKLKKDEGFTGDISVLKKVLCPLDFTGGKDITPYINGFIGRKWVFDKYENWLKSDSSSRLLWITGEPGFGKTAIAANLIHMHSANIIAHWFCRIESSERKDPLKAIKTIAYQIAYRMPQYLQSLIESLGLGRLDNCKLDKDKELEKKIEEKREKIEKIDNASDLFETLFNPLDKLIDINEKFCIVIDGLDEAVDKKNNNPIAELIANNFLKLNSKWLCFIVTSRPDPSVIKNFTAFKPFELKNTKENENDLREYLKTRFAEFKKEAAIEEEDKKIEELIKKSDGLILYLDQVIDGIKNKTFDINDINSIPKGMNSIYNKQFKHRFEDYDYEKDISPIFALIIAYKTPIPEKLLENILQAVEQKDDVKFNIRFNSIGSYIKNINEELSVFHKSLLDWLVTDKNTNFFITENDIKRAEKRIGEHLYTIYKKNKDKDNEDIAIDIPADPFLSHLPDYIVNNNIEDVVENLIELGYFTINKILYNFSSKYIYKNKSYFNFDNITKIFYKAVEVAKKQYGNGDIKTINAYKKLAYAYYNERYFDKAIEIFKNEIINRSICYIGENAPETIGFLYALANIYYDKYKYLYNLYEISEEEDNYAIQSIIFRFEEVVNKSKKYIGEDAEETIEYMNRLGIICRDMNELDLAINILEEVVNKSKKYIGEDAEETIEYLYDLALAYHYSKDLNNSKNIFSEVLEKEKAGKISNNYNKIKYFVNYAMLLEDLKDINGCIYYLKKARNLSNVLKDYENEEKCKRKLLDIYLGKIDINYKNISNALDLLTELSSEYDEQGNPNVVDINMLGDIYSGKFDKYFKGIDMVKAIKYYEKACNFNNNYLLSYWQPFLNLAKIYEFGEHNEYECEFKDGKFYKTSERILYKGINRNIEESIKYYKQARDIEISSMNTDDPWEELNRIDDKYLPKLKYLEKELNNKHIKKSENKNRKICYIHIPYSTILINNVNEIIYHIAVFECTSFDKIETDVLYIMNLSELKNKKEFSKDDLKLFIDNMEKNNYKNIENIEN